MKALFPLLVPHTHDVELVPNICILHLHGLQFIFRQLGLGGTSGLTPLGHPTGHLLG